MNNRTAVESRATASREEVIVNVLEERANGEIKNAIIHFADEFQFKDYGIGLEFHDKKSLDELFEKTRVRLQSSSRSSPSIAVEVSSLSLLRNARNGRLIRWIPTLL